MDERRSWARVGLAVGLVAIIVSLLATPARQDGPGPSSDGGSYFDQQVRPVGVVATDCSSTGGCPEPPTSAPARSTTTAAPRREIALPQPDARAPASPTIAAPADFSLTGYRWNACRTITVSSSGPDLQAIVAELASTTGLRLQMVSGAADIVVGWGSIPLREVLGATQLVAQGSTILHASVVISSRATPSLPTVLRHEMAHAVGLGHAQHPDEIMYPVLRAGAPVDYQGGDRAGLRAVGAPASGC